MKIFNCAFLFISVICFSQNSIGVVYYGELQSLGLEAPIGYDYSAVLYFNNNRSLYVTRKDSLENASVNIRKEVKVSNGGSIFAVSTNKQGFQYYNDLKNKKFFSRDLGFKYVKENTPKIQWKLSIETKTIGTLKCQKATTKFRGREYTAWFAKDIPLPFGPWKLQGLPGLILEAYDTKKEIYWYFKALEYPCKRCAQFLKHIEHGNEWISFMDFKKFLLNAHNNSVIQGRIIAEKIEGTAYKNTMGNSYIEIFDGSDKVKDEEEEK